MISAATREAQATACLEAGAHFRAPLLALAAKLTGSAEGGMDLYQQTLLNCHDAIQRHGFAGTRYEFYLYTSLKNLHRKEQKAPRPLPLPSDYEAPETLASPVDAHATLAAQVAAEVSEQFTPAERVALRLHVDGFSCQQIVELTGSTQDRRRLWERLEAMKAQLRHTFQQAWEGLAG